MMRFKRAMSLLLAVWLTMAMLPAQALAAEISESSLADGYESKIVSETTAYNPIQYAELSEEVISVDATANLTEVTEPSNRLEGIEHSTEVAQPVVLSSVPGTDYDFVDYIGKPDEGAIEISSPEELAAIRNDLSGNYVLTRDIDMSGVSWSPIGGIPSQPFKGKFDGQGHKIFGLSAQNVFTAGTLIGRAYGVGLFGICDGAEIENLFLENVNFSISNTSGYTYGTEIDGQNVYVGGIAGYTKGNTVISNCVVGGSVTASASGEAQAKAFAGGLVGYTDSTRISACSTNCVVQASYSSTLFGFDACAGGLVGYAASGGNIERSYSKGSVTAQLGDYAVAYAGGLLGYSATSSIVIENSFNASTVTAKSGTSGSYFGDGCSYAGGIAGYFQGTISCVYNGGAVTASATDPYGIGSAKSYAGGICAVSSSASAINDAASVCSTVSASGGTSSTYRISNGGTKSNTITISRVTSGSQNDASLVKTEDEMCTQDPYDQILGWDFRLVWEMISGKDFPQLRPMKPDDYVPTVPANKYLIIVSDPNGMPLSGVALTYNSQSGVTDANGECLFDRLTVDQPLITAKLDGYITWTNEHSNWTKSSNYYTNIILYPDSYSTLMLSMALYKLNPGVHGAFDSLTQMPVDLLTRTKKLNLKNDGNLVGDLTFGDFTLVCSALDTSIVREYQLWQNNVKIASSSDGNFSLNVANGFTKGGNCFVRVIGSDGRSADTNINLTFTENTVQKETGVSVLKDKISITVSDGVPFLGGSTFNVGGVGLLPVEIKATEDKFYIGFNSKIWDSSDTSSSQTLGKFDKFKKSLQTAMNANATLGNRDADLMNSLMKMEPDFALPGGSVKFNVIGYAEANWGSSTATGELYIVCKATTPTLGFTTWVVVVPVTVQISGYLEFKFGAKISYNWESSTFNGEIPVTLTLGLDAFGGIGVGKAIGVGAYGSANVAFGVQLFYSPLWKSIDLTGDLGIKAYLGPFEYKKSFAHNTWHIYTANTVEPYALEDNNIAAYGIYNADGYVIQDLSYLAEESDWHGASMTLYDATASTTLNSLLKDTYRNAQPMMISTGNGLYAVLLCADSTSGEIYTVATKYNGASWSEPVRLDDSAIMDSAPQLLGAQDGTIWVAYAQTDAGSNTSTLLNWAQSQTVVLGTLDKNSLAFTKVSSFGGTGYVHDQTLAMVNGQPTLVWIESTVESDNDVLAPTTNTVYYAALNGSTWSEAKELATINHPIWQIAAGDTGIVCNVDVDNDINTTEDAVLMLYDLRGDAAEIAAGVIGNVTYGILPGESTSTFMWNGDNCLVTSNGKSIAAEGITREYAVTRDRIYYSAAGDKGAHLTTVLFDGTDWGSAVTLTGGERYLENLNTVTWEGMDFLMGMDTFVTISENDVDDAKNLVWAVVMPSSDLRLDGITYDDEGISVGGDVPVTVSVYNVGDHVVENITLEIDGKIETYSCSLKPGETWEIQYPLVCTANLVEHKFSVSETGAEDFTPDDNSATVLIGFPDLSIEVSEKKIGTYHALELVISNKGISAASGVFYLMEQNGTVLMEQNFDDIPAGDAIVVTYSGKLVEGDYTASVVSDVTERYTYNNSDTVYVMEDATTDENADFRITRQPISATYVSGAVAAPLTVAAVMPEGADISFQWYVADNVQGLGAQAIENASSDSYVPDVSTVGKLYYYVEIVSAGKTLRSQVIAVEVVNELLIDSGTCGDGVVWELTESGVLTLSGDGKIPDYTNGTAPWYTYRDKIISVQVLDGISYIGAYTFAGCSALQEIVVSDSIESVGSAVLQNCSSLRRMTIPFVGSSRDAHQTEDAVLGQWFGKVQSGVTQYYVLSGTSLSGYQYGIPSSLAEVVITDADIIPFGAFYNCSQLTSVILNQGITEIEQYACRSCSSLTEIEVPDSVQTIQEGAFYDCSSLEKITIPFVGTSRTSTGYEGVLGIIFGRSLQGDTQKVTQYHALDGSSLSGYSYNIPVALKEVSVTDASRLPIGSFSNLTTVKFLSLNTALSTIHDLAFYQCTGLTDVYYKSYRSAWDAITVGNYNSQLSNATLHCLEDVIVVPVTSISLNKTVATLTAGETEALTATVNPADATNKTVTWTSSNPNVATVVDGMVTAKAAGLAVITATTEDSSYEAVCTITVNAKAVAVTGITLDKSAVTLTVGETEVLTATVNPTDATNKTVTWTSSDPNVVTVVDGVVTAKAAGSVVITATTEDGSYEAVCTITVNAKAVAVTSITLDKGALTLTVGETEALTATVNPTDATNKAVTWASSNPDIATVVNGVVTAKATGSALITAVTEDGRFEATCNITVDSRTVSVTGITLDKSAVTLAVGDTETLTVTVTPENATNKVVTWTSSDPDIVSVEGGVITAKSAGSVLITVATEDGGLKKECVVIVVDAAPDRIRLIESELTPIGNGTVGKFTSQVVCPDFAENKSVTVIIAFYNNNGRMLTAWLSTCVLHNGDKIELTGQLPTAENNMPYTLSKVFILESEKLFPLFSTTL